MLAILPLNNVVTALAAIALLWDRRWSLGWGWTVWGLWCTVVALQGGDRLWSLVGLLNLWPFLRIYGIARRAVSPQPWLTALAIGSLPAAALSLVQGLLGPQAWHLPQLLAGYTLRLGLSDDGRATSWFGHYNEAGAYFLLVLWPSLWLWQHRRQPWGALAAGGAIAGIVLSGSRNVWAWTLVGLLIWLWKQGQRQGVGILAGLAGAIAWGVWGPGDGIPVRSLLPESLVNRLASTFDPQQPDFLSTLGRWHAWQAAAFLWQQRPFTGWGWRNFPIDAAAAGFDLNGLPHEHNLYWMWAVGGGLPALVGFLVLMGRSLRSAWQAPVTDPRFACSLAVTLFYGLGFLDIPTYELRGHLLSWLLLAIADCETQTIVADPSQTAQARLPLVD
ncbi:MAG: O-antigen ligase family protein [Pseudanabaenaceae cyanobacterium]